MDYSHNKSGIRKKVSILEEGAEFLRVLSRNSSVGCSSRILYYRSAEGVPFKWEMQPGTPKDPPKDDIIPPPSPSPAMLSLGLPKPCINVEEPKPSIRSRLMFWKKKQARKSLKGSSTNINVDNNDFGSDNNSEFYSSDTGEEYFMASPARNSSSSTSSSSSSLSFSNARSSFRSPRLQSSARDSVDHDHYHKSAYYGCSPLNNFTSILVRVVARKA